MTLIKKISFGALLLLPAFLLLSQGTETQGFHIQGDQQLSLPLEPTASIIEVGPHYKAEHRFVSTVYESDHSFELLGLNWEEVLPDGTSASIEIRFRSTDGDWTDWQNLEEDHDHPDGDEALWTYVITEESEAFQYRVFLATQDTSLTPKLSNVSFDAVDGGESSPLSGLQRLIFRDDDEILSREDWDADEEMLLKRYYGPLDVVSDDDTDYTETDPDLEIVKTITGDEDGNPYLWPQTYPEEVKKIIIHHTATSGSLDDPEESIRAIYYYHAVTRGWGDIGYNYIITPDGQIFQGRAGDEGVVAGHASGYNTGTIGIALLGNYEENPVPGDMMQALTALVYEKADLHNIDVDGMGTYRGEKMENLLGHRDVDSTACPGDYTYDYLKDIRSVVAAALEEDNELGEFAYKEITDRELVLLDQGDKVGVTIKIENTGDETWDDGTYLVVNSNSDADSIITIPKDSKKRTAMMKEDSVKPGKTATFSFTVTATDEGGIAYFDAAPVFNGNEKSSEYMELGFYVEVTEKSSSSSNDDDEENSDDETDGDDALVIDTSDDLNFEPGETKYVWIQVKNNSDTVWSTTGSKVFSLAFTKPKGMETGTPFISFKSLNPGSSSRIYFNLTAPDEEGDYDLSIRPRLGSTNLSSSAETLSITVGGEEEFVSEDYQNPIRIKLTPDNAVGTPIVSSKASFAVYAGEELLEVFDANARVRVTPGNTSTITSGSDKWTTSEPVRFVPEEGGILKVLTMEQRASWDASINDNQFRGTLEIRMVDEAAVIINELPLESYLMGMAEETNSTPEEKLKTMAILARSYAYYYLTQDEKFPGMPYDGEDDPNTFQKYLGYGYELRHPNVVQAAQATEGMVVVYKGKVIKTPYFSQSDGVKTKSAKEVWGWTNTPYLVSVPDTYCESTTFAGHGVGLSGCGAKALAELGWTFEEIIKYYYTGVELDEIE